MALPAGRRVRRHGRCRPARRIRLGNSARSRTCPSPPACGPCANCLSLPRRRRRPCATLSPSTPALAVVEEHVAQGGAGPALCLWALQEGLSLRQFIHLSASNAPRSTYGSPTLHARTDRIGSCLHRRRGQCDGGCMPMKPSDWIDPLQGPILVLGAGGFVGANLLRKLLQHRSDVFGVVRGLPAWRLDGIDRRHVLEVDLNDLAATRNMVESLSPGTIFDTVAYGAYSFETGPRSDLPHQPHGPRAIDRASRRAKVFRLRARRQLIRIRPQMLRPAGKRVASPEQPLCRLQGSSERICQLRRQGKAPADRQSSPLLGLRPLRGYYRASCRISLPKRWPARSRPS